MSWEFFTGINHREAENPLEKQNFQLSGVSREQLREASDRKNVKISFSLKATNMFVGSH